MLLRNAAAGIAIAAAVFALSYANGGFAPTTRSYAGIAAWWLLGAGAAIGVAAALAGIDRVALAAVGLFAAFAIWVLISINWASDAERAFAQFNQVALYVAVLAIAVVVARLVPASVLVGGVALALVGIAGVALVSRCFPSTFGLQSGATLVPALKNRLSFPLGYWNGLGIEIALAYPILLAVMTSRRSRLASALAAFPLPILAAVMYLTSSRGAFAAAAVGIVAFLLLTPRRWPALAAVAVAGGAGAVAVAVLVPKKYLVNGDVDTALGVHQGHHAALWIGIACVLTALLWAGLAELGRRLPTPSRAVGRATAAALVVIVVAAIVAAHPISKFDAFKSKPAIGSTQDTLDHLLNSSGSGRWQFWGSAVSEFRAHPLNGGGAGSWRAWWLQHGSLKVFSEFAHSLYLEALGELGIVGLLLIAAAVLVAARGRDSLGLAARERGDRRRRRMRHRLFRRRCVRLGLATRGYSGRRCRDARLRTRGSSIHTRERMGAFGRPSTGDCAARGGGDNPAVRRPRRGHPPAQQPGCRRREGCDAGHGRRLSRPRPSSRGPPARIASLVSSRRPRATTTRPRTGWTRRSAARDATTASG